MSTIDEDEPSETQANCFKLKNIFKEPLKYLEKDKYSIYGCDLSAWEFNIYTFV